MRQKDAFVDAFLKRKRERFPGSRMILRQEGVKAIVAALRSGQALQLSPDMDLGARDSVFVPFFGVQTATVPALSRIARLAGARILPLVVRQLPWGRGYEARFYPAWENFPSGDARADTRRMNAFLEERIREMPEQYLWTHRRFKTRPAERHRYSGRYIRMGHMNVRFTKMQGVGNDFVVLDAVNQTLRLDAGHRAQARRSPFRRRLRSGAGHRAAALARARISTTASSTPTAPRCSTAATARAAFCATCATRA